MIYTTLNKIREHSPCFNGMEKLLRTLGKTKPDDEPLSLVAILDSNGFEAALSCLRTVDGHEREMRLFAVWCARQVQHLMRDKLSLDAIDVAERFAYGSATLRELDAAWARARTVARDPAGAAAWAAAWDVAGASACDAAPVAAGVAAWAAAQDAAGDYSWDARGPLAGGAAYAAARAAQEAKFREMFGGLILPRN